MGIQVVCQVWACLSLRPQIANLSVGTNPTTLPTFNFIDFPPRVSMKFSTARPRTPCAALGRSNSARGPVRYQGPPKHRPPRNPTKAAPCFEALHVSRDLENIFYIFYISTYIYIYRRKFRSETSDSTDSWKSRGGKSQRGREEERRLERRKREKKEDAGALKSGKVAIHCVSNDLWLQRVEK